MIRGTALGLVSALAMLPARAEAPPVAPVRVAIIIDDLGNLLDEGKRITALPGAVACSILPLTPHSREIAELAHAAGKEVMLHLPLQSVGDMPLGPGAITLDMTEPEIRATVAEDIKSIPYLAGVNNHEGSLITQHPGDMAWILSSVHAAGPYFYIDSYTSVDSVAYQVAREQGVPAARRNVFLDDVNTEDAVKQQWERLLKLARHNGFAIAIGHPRSATLKVLEEELPKLEAEGITLVPPSRIVELQERHPLPAAASLPAPAAVTGETRRP